MPLLRFKHKTRTIKEEEIQCPGGGVLFIGNADARRAGLGLMLSQPCGARGDWGGEKSKTFSTTSPTIGLEDLTQTKVLMPE